MTVSRLTVSGTKIYLPSGTPYVPVGLNMPMVNYIPGQDARIAAAMGSNVVRLLISWWYDGSNHCSVQIPNTAQDSFSATSPGYIDPTKLAEWISAAQDYIALGIWPIMAVRGADCNFGTYIEPTTGLPVTELFRAMWAYVSAQLVSISGIAAYELLSEPAPTNNHFDNSNNPATGHGPSDKGPGTAWLFNQVIQSIRLVDTITPIVIGPANTYNIRNVSQLLPNIYPANMNNIIVTANFFELGSVHYRGPQKPGGYVRQLNAYPGFQNGSYNMAYPGYFYDTMGDNPRSGPTPYPGRGGLVYMDSVFLSGLAAILPEQCNVFNVPCFIDQFGNATGTPGMYQYTSDVCDIFLSLGIGFIYWVQRIPGTIPNGANAGLIWQDKANVWHVKNGQDPSTLILNPNNTFGGQSTDDYYTLLSDKFAQVSPYTPIPTPPPPEPDITVTLSSIFDAQGNMTLPSRSGGNFVVQFQNQGVPMDVRASALYFEVGVAPPLPPLFRTPLQAAPVAATGTGSISGLVMSVTAQTYGTFAVGQLVTGAGVTAGTMITGLLSPNGSTLNYQLNTTQVVASTMLTAIDPSTRAIYLTANEINLLPIVNDPFTQLSAIYVIRDETGAYPVVCSTGLISLYGFNAQPPNV